MLRRFKNLFCRESVYTVPVSPPEDFLYVVLPYFNYCHFNRRLELFNEFVLRYTGTPKLRIVVVEGTTKGEPFQLPDYPNIYLHIKVELTDQVWVKENLINIGVKNLPPTWKYFSWIDADITFINTNWVNETIQRLNNVDVVQLFQTAINMGPEGEAMKIDTSFCYMSLKSGKPYHKNAKYGFWHPGFAWAMTKQAYNKLGGLLDCAILGSGDRHMALSLIGKAEYSYHGGVHNGYKEKVKEFEQKCHGLLYDYTPGTILHHFHGSLKDRRYVDRWLILVNHKYDPLTDIYYEKNGLIKFTSSGKRLQTDIRDYFLGRNEDGKVA